MLDQLWLLPEGIEELLPSESHRLEWLRRGVLDTCFCHGYDLVSPPLIEHLQSLLTGGGEDLDVETFKLIDYASGQQLGIRADMTPQIARIDSHFLKSEGTSRFCYAGPVLRARPRQAFEARELFQFGAELFGSAQPEADAEIVELMMECLALCGLDSVHVDIGHVGIFRALSAAANFNAQQESQLFDALQRKSIPDLQQLLQNVNIDQQLADALISLPRMQGEVEVLEETLLPLYKFGDDVRKAGENLCSVIQSIRSRVPDLKMYFDLSELRGYHYHTGLVFSAFVAGLGREIARGGRYDFIGSVFGRARPATGFSLDLRQVLKIVPDSHSSEGCILAPLTSDDSSLNQKIDHLRRSGERVVRQLDGSGKPDKVCCNRQLVSESGAWVVQLLEEH
ncbi:MAG: ATP phosphoribosyltransferase regulatory subunit [Parasphingorhabdus sp.]|jgi:ATP phosphoribosyltransferase regulatory subunit